MNCFLAESILRANLLKLIFSQWTTNIFPSTLFGKISCRNRKLLEKKKGENSGFSQGIHEFHETCHSVTFIVLVNSHQRWKQTRNRVCFHLWCELTVALWCHSIVWSLFSWNKMLWNIKFLGIYDMMMLVSWML